MTRLVSIGLALGLTLAAAAAPAEAAERRIYSYDAQSKSARDLTGAGLTFTFRKGLMSNRVQEIRATGVPVGVKVKPLGDGGLVRQIDGVLGDAAGSGSLYEIDAGEMQGAVMIRAFCPGSSRVWLRVGPLNHAEDLRVHAVGDIPGGGVRLCATMDFSWRGEWKLPDGSRGDATREVFRPDIRQPGS